MLDESPRAAGRPLLRCPRCGAPRFRGPYDARALSCMRALFEREQGYFVGAIYINYAFTVGITIAGFLVLTATPTSPRPLRS
jgi:hypothetical protein